MADKEYQDFGQIDFEDHEIELKIERDERLNKELNFEDDEYDWS